MKLPAFLALATAVGLAAPALAAAYAAFRTPGEAAYCGLHAIILREEACRWSRRLQHFFSVFAWGMLRLRGTGAAGCLTAHPTAYSGCRGG